MIAAAPKGSTGEVYPGSAADLNLGSFLDSVPVDIDGDAGVAKDQAGVDRLKEREEGQMTAAEKQKMKQEAFAADQKEGLQFSIPLPSLPKLF